MTRTRSTTGSTPPPAKKRRTSSSTERREESEQVINKVKDLSGDVEKLLDKVGTFMNSYENCHSENSSQFQLLRTIQKHEASTALFRDVKNKSTTINMAMVGATGRGKSFIANNLALYGTPVFKQEHLSKLLPSTVDADEEYDCVTVISFKLTYDEDYFRLKLHRRFDMDSGDDEEQNDIAIPEDKSEEDSTQGIVGEEREEVKMLYEYRHNGSLDEKSWLDQLANIRGLVDDTTDKINSGEIRLAECKFFEIEGPFPLLKSYNLSIYDIPGLTSDNDDIINSATATCKEANVVCLVNSMETRGKLENQDFNLLEPFVDKDFNQIPIVVFVDNVSRRLREVGDINSAETRKRIVGDQQVLDVLVNFIRENRHKSKFLPNINGYRRNAIVDKLLKTSFGFAFYGAYSAGSNVKPFSDLIGNSNSTSLDPLCTLQVCRRYLEERSLLQSKFLAVNCIFAIERDLAKKRFKNIATHATQMESIVAKEMVARKQMTNKWKAVCGRVIDAMDNEFTPVKIHVQRLWRKRLLSIIPTDLYFDIIENCLEENLQTCYDLLEENLRKMFKLNDSYEFPEDHEEEQQYDESNNPIIMSSDRNPVSDKPQDEIYLKVREALREFVREKAEELRSPDVLTDVQEKMSNILKNNIARHENLDFSDTINLSKQRVMDIVQRMLTHMINRRWSLRTKELLFGSLFTPNDSLTRLFQAFKAYVDGAELDQASVKKLKSSITKWKNLNLKKSQNRDLITMKTFQQRDWVEFSHEQVDISEKDLSKTKRAQRQSEKQITQNSVTSEVATKNFTNFVVNDNSPVQIIIDPEAQDSLIRITYRTEGISEENSEIIIHLYPEWQKDLLKLMKIPEASRIHPIFMPSYRRSKDIKKNIFFNGTDYLENNAYLVYLVVEEDEAFQYYNILKKELSILKLVFVTIPNGSRGIGFSRAMINLLQSQMNKLMKKDGNPAFEWFWTIDDDIRGVRMFNIDSRTLTMTTPCTLSLALLQSQRMLKDRIAQELKQIKGSENLSLAEMFRDEIDELLNTDERRHLTRVIETTITINKLLEFSTNSDEVTCYQYLRNICATNKSLKQKFAESLGQWLDRNMSEQHFRNWFREVFIPSHKSQGKIVQLAIVTSRMNDSRTNYNFLSRLQSHYRVSSHRYACVLNYAPGISGYNYLSFDQLLMNDEEVYQERVRYDKESPSDRKERIQSLAASLSTAKNRFMDGETPTVPNYELRDTFLGEDRRFIERLELDNKTGFQVFFFDIEWGKQKTGGCFIFRKKHQTY